MKSLKHIISISIVAGSNIFVPETASIASINYKDNYIPKKIEFKKPLVDPKLIDAMIFTESSGNPNVYNKGAVGLMQLRPIIYNKFCGLTKTEAFNPEKNKECGTKFVAHLIKKYKGDTTKALLHYNNGYKIRHKEYANKVYKNMKG